MDLDDVAREALHDWLNERPPHERPDPSEYEDLDPWDEEHIEGTIERLSRLALTPWPPAEGHGG